MTCLCCALSLVLLCGMVTGETAYKSTAGSTDEGQNRKVHSQVLLTQLPQICGGLFELDRAEIN